MGAPRFGSFLFGSLRGYRRGWLRADLLAGLAVWAVLVPESLAYAVLAGVPHGGGFVGGACGARVVCGVGQLAPPRGGADVGHRGALGGDRRRAHRGPGARGRPDCGTRPGDRPHHHGGRVAASGVSRGVRLAAGAQGLHHRAGADHSDPTATTTYRTPFRTRGARYGRKPTAESPTLPAPVEGDPSVRALPAGDHHALTCHRRPPPTAARSTWLPCSSARRRGSARAARPSAR